MEREISKHERVKPYKPSINTIQTKIDMWRKAWIKCSDIVNHLDTFDLNHFNEIFERWLPILNSVFNYPIQHLDKRYQFIMYYNKYPPGPKEIIHLYIEDTPMPEGYRMVYVIFNQHAFQKLIHEYCSNQSLNNSMLLDENRGTVNLSSGTGLLQQFQSAPYFRQMTICHLLFIFTLHALAHLNIFDREDHAHYENHSMLRDSPFFKLYFYGQVFRG